MLCAPEESEARLDELVQLQQTLMRDLGLCFRVRDMATHDLGAAAYRKFDLEAWMPSRNDYGELCSASNCTSYQTRRLNTRIGGERDGGKRQFAHSLNATALAVPRVLLALLETHQRVDGSVDIPPPLQPFIMGQQCMPFLPRK